MTLSLIDLNWLSIVCAALAYSFFSGMWHRPFAFGKLWDKAMGFERAKDWKESPVYFIVPFIGCIITTIALAVLSHVLDIDSLQEALLLGLTAGLGIATAVTFTNAIIPIMKHPLIFGAITGSAHLLGCMLAAVVLYLL
ncbi:MAG: DUF1761 domain-containing protein [Bacteroidota bacterium]